MLHHDLELLLRTSGGDVRMVAHRHIFGQSKLGDGEHRFLAAHLDVLTAGDLTRWLAFAPPCAEPIVQALVDRLPGGPDATLSAFFDLRPFAPHLESEVLDDLVGRLRDRLEPHAWQQLACQLRGMCPTFTTVARTEGAGRLALHLFDARRDERGCRAALVELVRKGTFELRLTSVFEKIGFPRPAHDEGSTDDQDVVHAVTIETVMSEATVRARASLVAWLELHDLLASLTPEDTLPELVHFVAERGVFHFGPSPERYLLTLALRWPGDGRSRATAWYVRQFLGAARRGATWGNLVVELMESQLPSMRERADGHAHADEELGLRMLDEIAWQSLEGPVAAPWLGASILAALNRGEPDAWPRAALYLERRDLHAGEIDPTILEWIRPYLYGGSINGITMVQNPKGIPATIVLQAPAPGDPGDDFDELVLKHRDLLGAPEMGGERLVGHRVFNRLAALPATRSRANRLVGMLITDPALLASLSTEILERLAAAADLLPAESLPPIEAFAPRPSSDLGARVAAYRRLGGMEADARVGAWMRAATDTPETRPEEADHARAFSLAMRMDAAPDLASPELLRALHASAARLCMPSLVALHRVVPALITEAMLVDAAATCAEEPSPAWGYWNKANLPACLVPAVRRRLGVVESEDEFITLARWLAEQGERADALIALFLPRLAGKAPGGLAMEWLASVFSSRSAWEEHGPRVLEVLIAGEAWGLVETLAERSARRQGAPAAEPAPGLVGAIHEALAVVLLRRVRRALDDGSEAAAIAALHALAALSPPSRFSRKLVPLRREERFSADVRELIELNLRLHRHGTNRDAALSHVGAALALLREGAA